METWVSDVSTGSPRSSTHLLFSERYDDARTALSLIETSEVRSRKFSRGRCRNGRAHRHMLVRARKGRSR